jgi:hypothetical protein
VSVARRPHRLALGIVLAAVAAGCSTGSTAAPATVPASTPAAATQIPGSSSLATTAPTKAATGGSAQVDLQFSGTRAITAKGTAGRCTVVTVGDRVSFGFEASESDYPGLGLSYSMANLNGDFVDIKWVIENDISYGNPPTGGGTLSADHHSVTVDVELSPFTSPGGTPGPEHVKGTITCP